MMAPAPAPIPSVITTNNISPSADPLQIHCQDTMTTTDFDSDASVSSLEHHCKTTTYSIHTPCSTPTRQHPLTPSSDHSHRNTQIVRVNVSGEDFAFPLSAFERFIGLPWKLDSSGVYCLNSSAAVFEVLLDYTLFKTYPAYDTLSAEEFQEFETMALAMGGLNALIQHFDRKDSYLAKELRQTRNRKSNSGRHFLINPEDSQSPSPNSIRATRVARFLGALCGVAESITRRRPSVGKGNSSSSPTSDKKGAQQQKGSSQQTDSSKLMSDFSL